MALLAGLAALASLAGASGARGGEARDSGHDVHGSLGAAAGSAAPAPAASVWRAADASRPSMGPAPLRPRQPAPSARDWLDHFADAGQAAALRQLAARHVVAAFDRGSGTDLLQPFTEQLCRLDPDASGDEVGAAALDLAGRSKRVVAHLRDGLRSLEGARAPASGELAGLTVATWIGNPGLDAGIVRAVRRAPELTVVVAAALRADRRAAGGAALALDCWHAVAASGNLGDEAAAAVPWFAGAPARHFAELVAEYPVARDATRRQRILFALGCAADGSTVQPLLEQLASHRREEALAAAYALAQLPHRDLRPLVPAAQRDPDAWLLRAALAQAGLLPSMPRAVELTVHGEPAPASFARFVPFALRCRDTWPGGRAPRGDADGIGTGG